MLMVLLQNAYGVEDGYVPSYERKSFATSHTGRRLRRAIPVGLPHQIINSNPKIGDHPDSCFPPNPEYVSQKINEINPTVILACGKIAEKTIELVDTNIPVLYMPHPAYRALRNATLDSINERLKELVQ